MVCTSTGQALRWDLTKTALSSNSNYLNSMSYHLYSVPSYVSNYSIMLDDFTHSSLNPHSAMSFLLSALSFSLKKSHTQQSLWSAVAYSVWSNVVWVVEMFIYPISLGCWAISKAYKGNPMCPPGLILLLFTIYIVYMMCRWYSFLRTMS